MEENLTSVSRSHLESLSTDELIKLADTYGIDIPPELERIFIIEELLEVSNMENDESVNTIEENPSYSETALMPKQYNISYIEVIIRDPLWVFVFWEIKGQERETHENANDFNGYCLQVIPLDKDGKEQQSEETAFTVSVNAEDNSRYLGFPSADETDLQKPACYVIKLNVIRGNNELLIASSAPFHLPKLCVNENIICLSQNALLRLSGVQDLSIIKNTDRQPRVKRQQ